MDVGASKSRDRHMAMELLVVNKWASDNADKSWFESVNRWRVMMSKGQWMDVMMARNWDWKIRSPSERDE